MIKLKDLLFEAVPSNVAKEIREILSKHSNAKPGIDFITKNSIVYPKTLERIQSMSDDEQIKFLNDLNEFINQAPEARKKALRKGVFYIYMQDRQVIIKVDPEPSYDSTPIENIQLANADGETFFDDDSAKLRAGKEQEIKNTIKQQIEQAKKSIPDGTVSAVGLAGLSIIAGTSKVPSKFGSGQYSTQNNNGLAKARADEFNRVVREALIEAGVQGVQTIKNDISTLPNEGPDWGDEQRKDTAKYGTTGNRTKAYEQEYEKHRFASAAYNLEIISNLEPGDDGDKPGGEFPEKQIYYRFLARVPSKEKRPPFRFPTLPGRSKNKLFATRGNPSECPFFDKPGILKKIAPRMVN